MCVGGGGAVIRGWKHGDYTLILKALQNFCTSKQTVSMHVELCTLLKVSLKCEILVKFDCGYVNLVKFHRGTCDKI